MTANNTESCKVIAETFILFSGTASKMNASYLELLVALASLVFVAESRSLKKCCDKLDPDAFRNIVSAYYFLISSFHLRTSKSCDSLLRSIQNRHFH